MTSHDVQQVRVRFCPSPTGNPHVGMLRTALFNWAYARHTGGVFVFRIEDTDSARDSEESYLALLEALNWMGLDWDEGPIVEGPYGPYRQSERLGLYADVAARLRDAGYAYECFCTAEELSTAREQAMASGQTPGYPGTCRELTEEQRDAFRTSGRQAALRLRMPGTDFTWNDLVRGPITFQAENVPDYVLVRANGEPLYTLVNPVDDAAMRITHVLRGEDLLSSTPRQMALYAAMDAIGFTQAPMPQFGHLPYVMGEGNKKLSKRDPESSLAMYRQEGYLPEGLLNYLGLLGWSMGNDQEFFSKEQMAQAFTLDRVSENPARFDLRKCTAINADWIRALPTEELIERLLPYLQQDDLVSSPPTPDQLHVLAAATPLIQERMDTLGQAAELLRFLLLSPEAFAAGEVAEADAQLLVDGSAALAAAHRSLSDLAQWSTASIESALRACLIEDMGLKPKVAFTPIRIAVTGRRVSPPLFESLEILGQPETLRRLAAATA